MVLMMAPRGNVTFLVPDTAACQGAASSRAAGFAAEKNPNPAPAPRRATACRRLIDWERESSVVMFHSLDREAAAVYTCLLYTSDAADERSSVDLGGRRI